jgi:ubiquinone/menaquinone biosynthesis C-methylase UbiE
MNTVDRFFMRMCGRPEGMLGRWGGVMMACGNRELARWIIDLLEIQPTDKILEVGFGPGVSIQMLARLAPSGFVAGVDYSNAMLAQATARNSEAIKASRVKLQQGTVERLVFEDNTFDKALAINSMQVWPDATAGIREMRRVIKHGGRIALGFNRYSRQPNTGLTEMLTAAGFSEVRLLNRDRDFCVRGLKP